jgi:hypothetical protein
MKTIAFMLIGTLSALPAGAAVQRSLEWGWSVDQDVTEEFSELLEMGELNAGDELVLEETYRISGTHELPDDFTLSAVHGAGFEVTDATDGNHGPFLVLGNGTTLHNLTVNYVNTPELGPHGTNPQHEKHFARMTGITASGKKNIRIENCRLVGSISHHLKFSDQCERPKIIGSHIVGGYWTILLSAEDALFRECLVESYQGDGIKTVWVKSTLVEECVFQDGGREGKGFWRNALSTLVCPGGRGDKAMRTREWWQRG